VQLGLSLPLLYTRQHLSSDDCTKDKRTGYRNRFVTYYLPQLCTGPGPAYAALGMFEVFGRTGPPILGAANRLGVLNQSINQSINQFI